MNASIPRNPRMVLQTNRQTTSFRLAPTCTIAALLSMTMSLTACGVSGSDSASGSATVGSPDLINASSKAAANTTSISTANISKLTPLQAVQKIFHDKVDWYPGKNDPNSSAMQSWASYAASNFFTSSRTYEQGYALLQSAIIADARQWDKSIPATGHPYPRASYKAPTLSWMTITTNTSSGSTTANGSTTKNLTPLQAVQKIFHDQVDWYPGNNAANSTEVQSWAQHATNTFFTSTRTYEQAYALLQAAILSDARQWDKTIPANGHPYPRAKYNAPTLSWMTAAIDTNASSSASGSTPAVEKSPTTPAPTPTPTPSTPATINTLDTIVNDMKLRNDLVLRGYENQKTGWYVGPGHVMFGNDPRLTNTPSWWKASNPGRATSEYMRALLPWVVIFDGVGHNAWNTRVQIRNFRAYYKSKSSGQWVSLGSSAGVSGAVYGKSSLFGATTPEDRRTNADGSSEIKPPANSGYAWHGWWTRGRVEINPTDIDALFVTLQSRLVLDNPNGPDDRANARYLVQVASDYYRNVATSWSFVVPSAMTARSKLVNNSWQAFSATTFSDVGVQEPGGGITEAAFRAAPPPLE